MPMPDSVSPAGDSRKCNICSGAKFKPAPGGRLSSTQLAPVCIKCGSLERHRVFRSVFDQFRSRAFKDLSCLMFSQDPSVAKGWFASMRYSVYGTESSLDVQRIALGDDAYDVVICNHILEHVPRYEDGMREILRVAKGFAFMSFPNPHSRKVTTDWGYPKPEQHLHYRIFGADIEGKLLRIIPRAKIVRVVGADPVTLVEDRAYIISKKNDWIDRVTECGIRCKVLTH